MWYFSKERIETLSERLTLQSFCQHHNFLVERFEASVWLLFQIHYNSFQYISIYFNTFQYISNTFQKHFLVERFEASVWLAFQKHFPNSWHTSASLLGETFADNENVFNLFHKLLLAFKAFEYISKFWSSYFFVFFSSRENFYWREV